MARRRAGGEYCGLDSELCLYDIEARGPKLSIVTIAIGELGGAGNWEYESPDERSATETGGVSATSDGILPTTGVGGTNIFEREQLESLGDTNVLGFRDSPVLSCPSLPAHDLPQAF